MAVAAALDLDPSRSPGDAKGTAHVGGEEGVEEGEGRWVAMEEKAAASPFPSTVPEPQLLALGGASMPSYPEISVAFPSLELRHFSQDLGPHIRK